MSSFYTLVRKSVGDLSQRSEREAVYERSRKALRTMQGQSSSFSTEQIAGQTRDLEAAISRVEQEMGAVAPAPDIPSTISEVPAALPPSESKASSISAIVAPAAPKPPSPSGLPSSKPPAERQLAFSSQRARNLGWIGKIRPDRRLAPRNDATAASSVTPRGIPEPKPRGGARRVLIGAAVLAVVIVPLALWFALRTPAPAPGSASFAPTDAATQPPPSESAWLDRGDIRAGGAVTWRPEPAGSSDRATGFHVTAFFEADARYPAGLRVAISMNGNVPQATNAAQIAEIRFTSKDDQPLPIKDVGGLLIRRSDADTGAPLLGLLAQADTPGLFILGTSPVRKDADANSESMRAAKWIDVPFVEGDGAAAIVSIPVEQNPILQAALNGWSAP